MYIATIMDADNLSGLDQAKVWNTQMAYEHLRGLGLADNKRTAERRLHELRILPQELNADLLRDELSRGLNTPVLQWAIRQARTKRQRVLFLQLNPLPNGTPCLHANDGRGARYWIPLSAALSTDTVWESLLQLQRYIDKPIVLFPHGELVRFLRDAVSHPSITLITQAYKPVMDEGALLSLSASRCRRPFVAPHLKRLEAESIYIIREAVAEARHPVMLYSMGKDSSVLLHLVRKAFYPAPPPFPLLHVDTRWKFQEMYLFRDFMARQSGMELIVHVNPEAMEKDINPFDHGSALHTDITKTEGLKQALDQNRFDVVLGGARRDEEKSRAKERIFSFRSATHQWDPKNQRPELWSLYNTRKSPAESLRVFPLSNWTELDIWQYIYQESIPVVPLYFAKQRAVVVRPEMIMMVDDERCRLLPGEDIQLCNVRFRTLGCYPLTGAVLSEAQTVEDILRELIQSRLSERQGRKIDSDSAGSMEKKKQEGYF
jgi:sulfate adenylyltransferase subunit 2